MSAAGFRYVLNYTAWFGSAQEITRFADQAAAAGIKVIWPLNDHAWRDGTDLRSHYRYLGPDCDCTTNAEFKRFALGLVKDHPATWGFYIGDEIVPTATNVAQVGTLSSEVEQIAPGKPTLYVTLPRDDLQAQLAPFVPHADVSGADYYPIGLAPDLSKLAEVASTTRRVTAQQGRDSALVLQAFSWSQYRPDGSTRFPTRSEMLRMRDLAIKHGNPSMLLWYAYNDLLESGNPAGNWRNLRAAAFAPHIQVRLGSSRCLRSGSRLRVTVRTASGLRRARALVDGRLMRQTRRQRFRVRVRGRGMRPGRHRIRVVAVDSSGRRATASAAFKRCS